MCILFGALCTVFFIDYCLFIQSGLGELVIDMVQFAVSGFNEEYTFCRLVSRKMVVKMVFVGDERSQKDET